MNNRLRYFVKVAQTRHFGRAAEALRMSQPPLSQQIRLLERELGLPLFVRTTRRVELTEPGRILYEGAHRALALLDQTIDHARRAHAGEAGSLRVGFVSTAALQLLADVLRAFRERYPLATVELFHLTSAQQAAAFDARTIDVGFLREPPRGEVEVEVVAREALLVALPATHALASRDRVPVRALRREPFVMWDRQQTSGIARSILELCTRHGFHPHIALEVTSPPAMLSLVAGGVGVAIVPASAMRLRPQAVVFRPLDDRTAYSPMALAWRDADERPLLANFVALAREIGSRTAAPEDVPHAGRTAQRREGRKRVRSP